MTIKFDTTDHTILAMCTLCSERHLVADKQAGRQWGEQHTRTRHPGNKAAFNQLAYWRRAR